MAVKNGTHSLGDVNTLMDGCAWPDPPKLWKTFEFQVTGLCQNREGSSNMLTKFCKTVVIESSTHSLGGYNILAIVYSNFQDISVSESKLQLLPAYMYMHMYVHTCDMLSSQGPRACRQGHDLPEHVIKVKDK